MNTDFRTLTVVAPSRSWVAGLVCIGFIAACGSEREWPEKYPPRSTEELIDPTVTVPEHRLPSPAQGEVVAPSGAQVVNVIPAEGTLGVPQDALIKITFSVPMDVGSTVSATILVCDNALREVQAAWDSTQQVLVLTPSELLTGSCAIQVDAQAATVDGAQLSEDFLAEFVAANGVVPEK